LLRAELARQEFYSAGRVPEFVGEVTEELKLRLTASIQLRENKPAAAAESLEAAERQRRAPQGTCDGQAFNDLRDMDDLTASVLEVLTSTGKYYWIPLERLTRVEFRKPQSVRDLIWRQAEVKVQDGPDGVVYLPALYPGSAQADNDLVRLGRMTDWLAAEPGPVRGIGQRMLLVGNEDRPFMELGCLEFAAEAS
jgi:type VI secretion system protein ImpE